jgi:hypothetical protein
VKLEQFGQQHAPNPFYVDTWSGWEVACSVRAVSGHRIARFACTCVCCLAKAPRGFKHLLSQSSWSGCGLACVPANIPFAFALLLLHRCPACLSLSNIPSQSPPHQNQLTSSLSKSETTGIALRD